MAGAAVVTAMMGPGGTATAMAEMAGAAVGGPVLLSTMVASGSTATAWAVVTSEGAGQAGFGSMLSAYLALCGRHRLQLWAPHPQGCPNSCTQIPAG
jgi:hypothetical protein